ncbi:Os04g0134601 [Oryza sativa Japonica Group]|nr:Os04g0134601 [Oryza sativa Japonica Group]
MAFFLAYYPSSEPPRDSNGYNVGLSSEQGLARAQTNKATGKDRFIAVEFVVTYNYENDTSNDRICIGISSVREPNYSTVLPGNTRLEGSMTSYISFNSSTRMLVASLCGSMTILRWTLFK